jgi:hypothetical protein
VPQSAAYVTLDEQDDTVNGGSYAYVIREEQQPPASAPLQQPQEHAQAHPPQLSQQDQSAHPGQAAHQDQSAQQGQSAQPGQAAQPPAGEDSQHGRGAFEPPAQQHPELAGLLHIDYDLLAGDSGDSLERLKDLYDAAEALGGEGIDRHFDELLERQRKLIGTYFTEFRTSAQAGSR